MRILAVETSCDETSAAIIEAEKDASSVTLLANTLATSLTLHSETGGIIPEIAAREQVKFIIPVIRETLQKAGIDPDKPEEKIDALAVTYGPGLIGSLLVGVETMKTLAMLWNKPLIPVNHMVGHIYANFIRENPKSQILNTKLYPEPSSLNAPIAFPALALVVSGGHTDILLLKSHKDIQLLGGTRDDAAGECFDKCARLLGYEYPGGPKISKLAELGNPKAFRLPRPMLDSHDYDFSFSGLKTAFLYLTKEHFSVLRTEKKNTKIGWPASNTLRSNAGWQQIPLLEKLSESEKQTLYDLCASLEQAIIDTISIKLTRAIKEYQVPSLLISGGVAANKKLTQKLKTISDETGTTFHVPPPQLCTDNAAMIASAAFYHHEPQPLEKTAANPELYF